MSEATTAAKPIMVNGHVPLATKGNLTGESEWNGIPELTELVQSGGAPGVMYCLVRGSELGEMQREEWEIVRGSKSMTIHGPSGSCDSVVLMLKGRPIPGASRGNGRRNYYGHEKLLVDLGYVAAATEKVDLSLLRAQTESNKAKATGAVATSLGR
jgi:hypothetical protein